ncbi:MAG: hypothetical protein NTW46_02150, partial [Candidatus Nealsonbacteria bacterium]|nr:hypothetical protein [Candidatus Nealsonbacteria bacterium]
MKNLIQKILKSRRLTIISVIIIIGACYFGYRLIFVKSQDIRYVLSQAQKGTLIASISGSGQVSASNQISIKPKVSG